MQAADLPKLRMRLPLSSFIHHLRINSLRHRKVVAAHLLLRGKSRHLWCLLSLSRLEHWQQAHMLGCISLSHLLNCVIRLHKRLIVRGQHHVLVALVLCASLLRDVYHFFGVTIVRSLGEPLEHHFAITVELWYVLIVRWSLVGIGWCFITSEDEVTLAHLLLVVSTNIWAWTWWASELINAIVPVFDVHLVEITQLVYPLTISVALHKLSLWQQAWVWTLLSREVVYGYVLIYYLSARVLLHRWIALVSAQFPIRISCFSHLCGSIVVLAELLILQHTLWTKGGILSNWQRQPKSCVAFLRG